MTEVANLIPLANALVGKGTITVGSLPHVVMTDPTGVQVAHLLTHGAEVDQKVHLGNGMFTTPLGLATLVGNTASAALLLKHGADPDIGGTSIISPVDIVTQSTTANPQLIAIVTQRSRRKRGKKAKPWIVRHYVHHVLPVHYRHHLIRTLLK